MPNCKPGKGYIIQEQIAGTSTTPRAKWNADHFDSIRVNFRLQPRLGITRENLSGRIVRLASQDRNGMPLPREMANQVINDELLGPKELADQYDFQGTIGVAAWKYSLLLMAQSTDQPMQATNSACDQRITRRCS